MKPGIIYELRMYAVVVLLEAALWFSPKENKEQGRLAAALVSYFESQFETFNETRR